MTSRTSKSGLRWKLINRLVANGERNQDQLTLKAIIFLKEHERGAGEGREGHTA
jgi:hypothetical protein